MSLKRRNSRIYKICLTGGPGAGKSTALKHLTSLFEGSYSVLTIPEIGTFTVESGFSIIPSRFTYETRKLFNQSISQFQIDIETYYENLALMMEKPVLMIIDRGVVDNFGYATPDIKEEILNDTKWDMNNIRNERYDLVIHMITAALGAKEAYTNDNNNARTETPEEAIVVDKKVLDEWLGHPNLIVIDNIAKGIETKLKRVEHCIRNLIEEPMLETKTFKFLLDKVCTKDDVPDDFVIECFDEIAYKNTQKNIIYVERKYTKDELKVYYSIIKAHRHENGEIHEVKKLLDKQEFEKAIKYNIYAIFRKSIMAFCFMSENTISTCAIENFYYQNDIVSVLRLDRDIDNTKLNIEMPFLKVSKNSNCKLEDSDEYIEY